MDTFAIWRDGEYVGCVKAANPERALRFFLGGDREIHRPEDERITCAWCEIEGVLYEASRAYQRNV